MPSTCPYCGTELAKKPLRKTKCPHCGEFIYVRNKEVLRENDLALLIWIDRLASFDIDNQMMELHKEGLTRRFGHPPPPNDIVWSILNSLVQKYVGTPSTLSAVYSEMSRLVLSEGKDPTPYIAEAWKHRIASIKQEPLFGSVIIRSCNDGLVCDYCKEVEDKEFTIDEIPAELPEKCMSDTGCRCWLSPQTSLDAFESELNDILGL